MARATWMDTVIAESDRCEVVEGNLYFPPDTLQREHLVSSATRTTCPWKGEAHYYDVKVGDETNKDAAWTYPDPKPAAKQIKDHVAFWRGVAVQP